MTTRVVFIVGLCGSGKSYLGCVLERQGFRLFDEGFLHSKRQHISLIAALRKGRSYAVIEIAYCYPVYRRRILRELLSKVDGVNIEWLYFANDRRSADHNCQKREGGKRNPKAHLKINRRLSRGYVIPRFVKPIPITRI